MKNLFASLLLLGLVLPELTSCNPSSASFQKQLQERLIKAKPGDIIELPKGKFQFDRTLSLSADKVAIRGKGMDKSILSFAGQREDGPGLLVRASDFTIEDLAIEDTAGDGLRVQGGDNITIRHVRVEWTRGANPGNGPYAINPIESKNVLVEDSVARGATNAGFHIGQSDNVVVRRNRAEYNVDGYEVGNSRHVDVYDNIATNNTGGLGVFNMPDLPEQGGGVRVFRNQIFANNTANFAPASLGAIYHLPTGTGIYIMAIHDIEVFQNKIHNHNTSNISIISYDPNPYVMGQMKAASAYSPSLGAVKNRQYNRFTEDVYIHGNEIWEGGKSPDVRKEEVRRLSTQLGGADVLYDGVADPATRRVRRGPNPADICLENNGVIQFLNYDYEGGKLWKHPDFRIPVRDVRIYACTLPQLEAVMIPQVPASTGQGRALREWEEKLGDTRLALMDPGKVSGNLYSNNALGFSYEFPAGWNIVDQAAQEKLMNAASRDFYRDGIPPDEHEARALCIRVLLWTTKYPETVTEVNPLAIVLAIVPDCYPGLTIPVKDFEGKYAREAVEALSSVFTGSSLLGDDDQKIRNFVRHDRNFVQVLTVRTTDARTDRPKQPIHSAVILTQVKGYWLAWLLVSDTHSELQQLQTLKVQFEN